MKRFAQRFGIVAFALAAAFGASALFSSASAHGKSCPSNTHQVVCDNGYTFCCPNNALCICP